MNMSLRTQNARLHTKVAKTNVKPDLEISSPCFYQMFNMCVFNYAFARLIRVHLKVSVSI